MRSRGLIRLRLREKGFTLIQVLIALAMVIILASVGAAAYDQAVTRAKRRVCETNLKAMGLAIEMYFAEEDVLPATLGGLPLEYLEKGYAKVMEDMDWFGRMSPFIMKHSMPKEAYAQFLTYENLKKYGATAGIFHCPADTDGGVSYGINGNLVNKSGSQISDVDIIVADSDFRVFTSADQLSPRHKHTAMAITRGRSIVAFGSDGTSTSPTARIDAPAPTNMAPTTETGSLGDITVHFDTLVTDKSGTLTADMAADVRNKLLTAQSELDKSSPDTAAAQGIIEGAQADIQAMVNDGLMDPTEGASIITALQDISAQLTP
jgi:hypothetical protein